jgi:hypothetical protein
MDAFRGNFNSSLTQVKITIGILNGKARDKDFGSDIGIIPKVAENKSRERMMLESRHCDGLMAPKTCLKKKVSGAIVVRKLTNWRTITIAVILESYVDIQDVIIMDFHYNGSKLYKDVAFCYLFLTSSWIMKRVDKFCGKFGSSGRAMLPTLPTMRGPHPPVGRALVNIR